MSKTHNISTNFFFQEKGDDLPRSQSTIHRPADVGSHIVTVFLKFLKEKYHCGHLKHENKSCQLQLTPQTMRQTALRQPRYRRISRTEI